MKSFSIVEGDVVIRDTEGNEVDLITLITETNMLLYAINKNLLDIKNQMAIIVDEEIQ